MSENLTIEGAREHNLKNINVHLPLHALTVFTGLSGSGKSSLAFDTIYAEGQRRYIETFSAYARGFLGQMERPDVDHIGGLSPVISIEQKTTGRNPRSTVGTVTEIYDFLRLLFARAADAYSYETGERMVRYTEDQIIDLILSAYADKRIYLLAPLVRRRKGHYRELFEQLLRKGFVQARVDGEIKDLTHGMRLDRYRNHDIELVVDKLQVRQRDTTRLRQSVAQAFAQAGGMILLLDRADGNLRYLSKHLMCPTTGLAYRDPAPHTFSFNSKLGACPRCHGLGEVEDVVWERVAPNPELSIAAGGLAPLKAFEKARETHSLLKEMEAQLISCGCNLSTPLKDLPEEAVQKVLYGEGIGRGEKETYANDAKGRNGLAGYIAWMTEHYTGSLSPSPHWVEQYITTRPCPLCHGTRLCREALSYRIDGRNIGELAEMDIRDLYAWTEHIEEHLKGRQRRVAHEVIKELHTRLKFLLDVGLDYLSLSRASSSLSGGESQRIRLATQIGSQLINVLYILDEPSIGLHQRDNIRLIRSLKALRDLGNTVIVVEHDKDMMLSADYIVDLGPGAGRLGGGVVFQGTPQEMLKTSTLTARYLTGTARIPIPSERRRGSGKRLSIGGARGNNLKNITVDFPLGTFICVTGVSGSGKSSLVTGTLLPILSHHLYRSLAQPLPYEAVEGLEHIDKVIAVDQSPIGRTPRSNPATYTGVFTDIRQLFVQLPEAKMRGYKLGRFSFNVTGGRCEDCKGAGYRTIEMNFLPDVYLPCETCRGKRYNRETLEVRYKGKSIADVLAMTVDRAVEFFESVPHIARKLKVVQDVGLGYLTLGQNSATLSGGESQRIKLAAELSRKDTGSTLYILDEPTTGLHFEDIRVLLSVLNRLIGKGNTVIVIEHNLDVIAAADYVIDIGPEGGQAGGEIVATGTPEEVAQSGKGYTAGFIAEMLQHHVGKDH